MRDKVHPLLISDILLSITELILQDINTPRERWLLLVTLMLIHPKAREILIDQASLWRFIDIDYRGPMELFLKRAQGRNIRPSVWTTVDLAEQAIKLSLAADAFELFSVVPEALSIRTAHSLDWNFLQIPVWQQIRLLSIAPLGSIAWFKLMLAESPPLLLDNFTQLESLSVEGCTVTVTKEHSSLKHLQFFTSYPNFLLQPWIELLNNFSALEVLEIRGTFWKQGGGMVELELPTLRDLRLYAASYLETVTVKAPLLERAIIWAHKRTVPADWLRPSSTVSPRHLQIMASLTSEPILQYFLTLKRNLCLQVDLWPRLKDLWLLASADFSESWCAHLHKLRLPMSLESLVVAVRWEGINEANVPPSSPNTFLDVTRTFRQLYGVPLPRFSVLVTSKYEDAHLIGDPNDVQQLDVLDIPDLESALFGPKDYPWKALG